MKIVGELVQGKWTTPEGQERDTYKIVYNLGNGQSLDLPIKSDKAKIIILASQLFSKEK